MPPLRAYQTQVCAVAKRDLAAGDYLDGIGGDAAYGRIENQGAAQNPAGLPIFLTENARLLRNVKKDHPITWQDVQLSADDTAVRLYQATLATLGEIR